MADKINAGEKVEYKKQSQQLLQSPIFNLKLNELHRSCIEIIMGLLCNNNLFSLKQKAAKENQYNST
jgi:hypothetical protein